MPYRLFLLLVMAAVAFAEGAPSEAPASAPGAPAQSAPGFASMLPTFAFLALMIGFMWFFIIRPQRKEDKRRKELIESMKRGDQVVTIGGVHGEVVTVGETTVDVRIGGEKGLVVTFNKGAVQQNATAEKNAADAKK